MNRVICIASISCVLGVASFAVPQAHSFPLNLLSKNIINPQIGESFVLVSDSKTKLQTGAEKFVDNMARDGIGFLSNDGLTQSQKEAAFKRLLHRSFDMDTISRFALGRYWRTSSAEQRKEYTALFKTMIVDVYTSRFGEYSGEDIQILGSRQDSEKDITVQSVIVSNTGGSDIDIDWRVRYKNGKYRIVDVVVEGVSMALTQRSDFASVIQRGGGEVSVLLAHLKEQ